jgi:hypothetical protein
MGIQCFVLAFLHVSSREVWGRPTAVSTGATWMKAQAEAFVRRAEEQNRPARLVLLDRDCAYGQEVRGDAEGRGREAAPCASDRRT